jgi:hypothetical protein
LISQIHNIAPPFELTIQQIEEMPLPCGFPEPADAGPGVTVSKDEPSVYATTTNKTSKNISACGTGKSPHCRTSDRRLGESHSGLRLTNGIYRTVSFMEVGGLSVPGEVLVVIQRYEPQQTNDAVLQLCNEPHMVATNVVIGKTPPRSCRHFLMGKPLLPSKDLTTRTGWNSRIS